MTWAEMEVSSCLRTQYHPLLSARWSCSLCNLFVPSLSTSGSTIQNLQEITGSGGKQSYLLHLEGHWLLSWPQLARRERGRLFIFAKDWETEWVRLCCVSYTGQKLGGEGLASFSLRNLSTKSHQISHPSSWVVETKALTKLGVAKEAQV